MRLRLDECESRILGENENLQELETWFWSTREEAVFILYADCCDTSIAL